MRKSELTAAVDAAKDEYRDSLQLLWNNVNKGQRIQLLKNEAISAMLERYDVNTGE